MKVLQINAVYEKGSTGRIARELHEALLAAGHESIVAAARNVPQDAQFYCIGNKLDWKLHALLSRLSGKQAYFSRFYTKKLLHYLDKEKPDVVHLGNLHTNYIHFPSLLKYLARHDIATVITLHDCWFFTGKCTHYIGHGCNRWQEGCHHCPKLKEDNPSWLFDRTAAVWRDKKTLFYNIPRLAVVGVSDWITNEAKKSILKDAFIIRRIYNWIDTDIFAPKDGASLRQKLGLGSGFVILGASQVWTREKGLYAYVELAKRLPEFSFVLVGRKPAGLMVPLNLLFVGDVNSADELATYYSMADVFLNPSRYETFGKTTAEALSCGTPVIAYRVTATPELVDSRCGILIDAMDDYAQIEAAIQTIKTRTKQYYSTVCRASAVERFSKADLIAEHIALYEDLMKTKKDKV